MGDLIRDALSVGKAFDWISPLLAIGQNIANGPSKVFVIPQECGWTGYEIKAVLRRGGVQTWGLMAINDVFTISVRRTQEAQASRILAQNRIPTEG